MVPDLASPTSPGLPGMPHLEEEKCGGRPVTDIDDKIIRRLIGMQEMLIAAGAELSGTRSV